MTFASIQSVESLRKHRTKRLKGAESQGLFLVILILLLSAACGGHKTRVKSPLPAPAATTPAKKAASAKAQIPGHSATACPEKCSSGTCGHHRTRTNGLCARPPDKNWADHSRKGNSYFFVRRLFHHGKGSGSRTTTGAGRDSDSCRPGNRGGGRRISNPGRVPFKRRSSRGFESQTDGAIFFSGCPARKCGNRHNAGANRRVPRKRGCAAFAKKPERIRISRCFSG